MDLLLGFILAEEVLQKELEFGVQLQLQDGLEFEDTSLSHRHFQEIFDFQENGLGVGLEALDEWNAELGFFGVHDSDELLQGLLIEQKHPVLVALRKNQTEVVVAEEKHIGDVLDEFLLEKGFYLRTPNELLHEPEGEDLELDQEGVLVVDLVVVTEQEDERLAVDEDLRDEGLLHEFRDDALLQDEPKVGNVLEAKSLQDSFVKKLFNLLNLYNLFHRSQLSRLALALIIEIVVGGSVSGLAEPLSMTGLVEQIDILAIQGLFLEKEHWRK